MGEKDNERGNNGQVPSVGIRKNGKPYKEGNTREDGSYVVGGKRPPTKSQYSKDDGRLRGTRGKGRKNLLTEWREELDAKIPINENGVRKRVSKRRALIKSKIKRGIEKSDRAAETALRYDELSERRDPGLQADDLEIIEAWFKGVLRDDNTDDADLQFPPERREESGDETALNEPDGDA
jgi:hypothetical protein